MHSYVKLLQTKWRKFFNLCNKQKGVSCIMPQYHAMDIARWFLYRNQLAVDSQGGEPMTLLKLLKLLYYAEGCSLGLDEGSLFPEKIYAWDHGPVVREVWEHYTGNAYKLLFGSDEDLKSARLVSADTKTANILENVFRVFGQYSAWALREKTHKEDPWIISSDNGEHLNGEISRDVMKRYFKEHYVDNG